MPAKPGSSSVSVGSVSDNDLKEFITLSMDITLAGGITAVGHLPVADIRTLTLEVRHKGACETVTEETRRTVDMKLCLSGTADANLLYSLGDTEKHWIGCHDLNPDVKAKLVYQILAQVKSSRE
jgi:hypothetical protein